MRDIMEIELLDEPSTELTVQARAAVALSSSKTRQDLMVMAAKSAHLVEIKNKAARDEIHGAAMALVGARTAISKTGKAARDDATKFSKAVIAEEASLIAITEPEEKRLLALRDAWDEVVAAERAAREAAERTRIMAITERIAGIRQYVELAASCRTAARIHELQSKLASVSLEGFEEFADEAAVAHADAMKRVEALLVEKHLAEQEQERIKAEQAAAAAKLATERAEFAAQQAAAKVEASRVAERVAAERKALADEQERINKANRDAAILEADRIATERQRLADERQAFEDQVLEARIKAAQAEAAETRAIVAANKAMLDQQAEDAAMIATHEEEVRQAEIVDAEVNPESVFALTGVMATAWEPSDAECMWEAIKSVSAAFDMTTEQATARLAAVQWTI